MPALPPVKSLPFNITEEPKLPLATMIKTLHQATLNGPEAVYDVMLKIVLMMDAVAPTYALSIFTQKPQERPTLMWIESSDEEEISAAEQLICSTFVENSEQVPEIKAGDQSVLLKLVSPSSQQDGVILYGRFVRPLTPEQAADFQILAAASNFAHSYHALHNEIYHPEKKACPSGLAVEKLPGMIYVSRVMQELANGIERVKDSDSTVLVSGESGTGKELVARAIHRLSRRCHAPFIPFNCTTAPADLVESLLFGHRKGAFTGAHADQPGLVRAAEGGTLFLDEIGDLPLNLQPKLLRFLQEGEIHALGETRQQRVNVRVVVATHKDLEEAVRNGTFREDLYYRISTLPLKIPPLRERPEDIAELISHFLTYYARRNDKDVAGITMEAISVLENYRWPGNVRELAAEMERLVLYTDVGSYIRVENLSERMRPDHPALMMEAEGKNKDLDVIVEDFERRVITEALKDNNYNISRSATALGLTSRQALHKKLKRLEININDFTRAGKGQKTARRT